MLRPLSSGFTLVETIIVVTVCGILTGLLFGPLSDLYAANTQGLSSIIQATDVKAALRQMEKTIALGNSFIPKSWPDAGGKVWSWDDSTGLLDKPLIISSYAIETNTSGNRVIAIKNDATCLSFPQQMSYSTVFFVKNNTLYRRVIKPTPATTCDSQPIEQKNTCESPAANPTNCTSSDAVLATNVTGFTIQYYAASNSTSATSPTADQDFVQFKTVTITLQTTIGVGSTKTQVSNSLRMSLINV